MIPMLLLWVRFKALVYNGRDVQCTYLMFPTKGPAKSAISMSMCSEQKSRNLEKDR